MNDEYMSKDEALRTGIEPGDLAIDTSDDELRLVLCTELVNDGKFRVLQYLDGSDTVLYEPDDGVDCARGKEIKPRRFIRVKPTPDILRRKLSRAAEARRPVSIRGALFDACVSDGCRPEFELGQEFSFSRDIHEMTQGRVRGMELSIIDILVETDSDGAPFFSYVCKYKSRGFFETSDSWQFIEILPCDMEILANKELVRRHREEQANEGDRREADQGCASDDGRGSARGGLESVSGQHSSCDRPGGRHEDLPLIGSRGQPTGPAVRKNEERAYLPGGRAAAIGGEMTSAEHRNVASRLEIEAAYHICVAKRRRRQAVLWLIAAVGLFALAALLIVL